MGPLLLMMFIGGARVAYGFLFRKEPYPFDWVLALLSGASAFALVVVLFWRHYKVEPKQTVVPEADPADFSAAEDLEEAHRIQELYKLRVNHEAKRASASSFR
jgi:hypothetical protein